MSSKLDSMEVEKTDQKFRASYLIVPINDG